jgi:DNA-binding beta-propeller fold protein YncE
MLSKLKIQALTLSAVLLAGGAAFMHTLRVYAAQDAGTYQLVPNWAKLPDGTTWGLMPGVATDAKGNIYAFQRSDPAQVMVFDAHGKYLKSWGSGEFEFPHALTVGPDGSVWAADKKREQVLKFSPDGKLLMTIGQKDVTGNVTSEDAFNGLADMAIAKNGDIFISDGENSAPGVAPYNNRVVKFSKDGKFIKFWGMKGDGQGDFSVPHSIAIDSKGRVWVGDRGNKRLQIFDQDGKYLDQMTQFGAPASIYITKDDTLYVGGKDVVTVGKTDGTVLATIPDVPDPHGIAVDEKTGAIYVSQVGPKAILKYVKK